MVQELLALVLFAGMVVSWVLLPSGEAVEEEAAAAMPVRQAT